MNWRKVVSEGGWGKTVILYSQTKITMRKHNKKCVVFNMNVSINNKIIKQHSMDRTLGNLPPNIYFCIERPTQVLC